MNSPLTNTSVTSMHKSGGNELTGLMHVPSSLTGQQLVDIRNLDLLPLLGCVLMCECQVVVVLIRLVLCPGLWLEWSMLFVAE